jgi:uncharacterized protein YhaN
VRSRIESAIQDHLRTEELPDLVVRASTYFTRFTGGRYRLELGAEQHEGLGLLLVRDATTGNLQKFEELSTGTKVHAVIAVRLALISEQESKANGGNIQFPLVADEALAVSDPRAGRAIAEALVEVARERQVVVFTHQPQDAALFERLDPGMKLIELGPTTSRHRRPRRSAARPETATELVEQPLLGF